VDIAFLIAVSLLLILSVIVAGKLSIDLYTNWSVVIMLNLCSYVSCSDTFEAVCNDISNGF